MSRWRRYKKFRAALLAGAVVWVAMMIPTDGRPHWCLAIRQQS
jgi:hypothetical protein